MTNLTKLALGIAGITVVGLGVYSTIQDSAPAGSAILTGHQYFITDANTTMNPGIYVNNVKVITLTGSATTNNALQFDSSNSQAACLKYGSRHTDCYQQVTFTNTGACIAAGCTGASGKSYHVAEITKPFTGSGRIKTVEVTCDGVAMSSTLYGAQVAASSTISGTNIFGIKTVGSGSLIVNSTGGILWSELTPKIRIYTGKRMGAFADQCLLSVWSSENYNP